jgi:hypothetical protein
MTPDNQPAPPDSIERVIAEMRDRGRGCGYELIRYWADRLESLRRAEGATLGEGRTIAYEPEIEVSEMLPCEVYTIRRMLENGESKFNASALAALRAAEKALSGAPVIPNGWALVPTVPTEEMMDAWNSTGPSFEDAYSEMIAVATDPATPTAQRVAAGDDGLAEFTEYFVKNYPGPDTIISDPKWHAPRIFRAAQRAIAPPPTGEAVARHKSSETTFEEYVATLIDKNPDVQKLGERLADWLDEDRFNSVEPILLGIAQKLTHPAAQAEGRGVDDAMHWIDRYATGIDDELQMDRVVEALSGGAKPNADYVLVPRKLPLGLWLDSHKPSINHPGNWQDYHQKWWDNLTTALTAPADVGGELRS